MMYIAVADNNKVRCIVRESMKRDEIDFIVSQLLIIADNDSAPSHHVWAIKNKLAPELNKMNKQAISSLSNSLFDLTEHLDWD